MKLSNIEMENKIQILTKFLPRHDIIGYASARNIRRLKEASVEYNEIRNDLLNKYGTAESDEDGKPTGRIGLHVTSPEFKLFKRDIEPYAILEHEVTIFKIPYESVCEKLTGSEILEIDWMLEDSDSPRDCG